MVASCWDSVLWTPGVDAVVVVDSGVEANWPASDPSIDAVSSMLPSSRLLDPSDPLSTAVVSSFISPLAAAAMRAVSSDARGFPRLSFSFLPSDFLFLRELLGPGMVLEEGKCADSPPVGRRRVLEESG